MYADCLLKNTSIKHSKYATNYKLELFDDISFREHFDRIRMIFAFVFFCIKSVPSQDKVFVSTLGILFDETQLDQLL